LYPKATLNARYPGIVSWVRNQPLSAFIVLIRQARKHRKSLALNAKKRRSKHNQTRVRRERESWILVAALSLQSRTPKQIVKVYKTRIQFGNISGASVDGPARVPNIATIDDPNLASDRNLYEVSTMQMSTCGDTSGSVPYLLCEPGNNKPDCEFKGI
jgi:hypothetical protein